MDISSYKGYISEETMMGPNSVRILAELLERHPLQASAHDRILDLGCGTGLTSLVLAKETGAEIYANDLWVSVEDNGKRFAQWRVDGQVIPFCQDAKELHFEKEQFHALVSIDSYNYFAGYQGFFQEKLLPFMRDGAEVLIGVPGLKDAYRGRAGELLSGWLGGDACMLKSPAQWRELTGSHDRMKSVEIWEMDCFNEAWSDWLATENKFAAGDRQHFETVIKPYTCFVGMYIKL